MKKNIFIVILIIIVLLLTPNVNALEEQVDLQTELEEKFLKEAPKILLDLYNETNFKISPEWFDKDGKIPQDIKILNQYEKVTTKYRKGIPVESKSEIITKEEYNNFNKNEDSKSVVVGNCTLPAYMYNDCYETNAKRLTLTYYTYPESKIGVINTWKTLPSIKSYDTIGVYHDGKFTVTSANGWQYYDDNSQYYSYNGTNMKNDTGGISISQDIVNSVSSSLSNELWVYGYFNTNLQQLTASYQHAVTNISLATSKNFYFSGNGMGRVFYWNTSWSNWDNMQGVCANITYQYLWFC